MLEECHQMSNPPLAEIVDAAIDRRTAILTAENDLARLFDGRGDGLAGVYLETMGGHWLISTTNGPLNPKLKTILRDRTPGALYWKRLDHNQKNSPVHLSGPETPEFFTAIENSLTARLSFHSGYSQGIFLDQRNNRAKLRKRIQPGQTVLNTFSYTGFFSIAAAAAGATTSTLDLSQVYLDWARENFRLNGMSPEEHYFCKGDTFHWLRRFAKQGRKFDYIILDPPTFSRTDKGKIFRVEKDYPRLFELALASLAPGGTILACHNYRGMNPSEFVNQLNQIAPRANYQVEAMPEDFTESPYLKSVWATV